MTHARSTRLTASSLSTRCDMALIGRGRRGRGDDPPSNVPELNLLGEPAGDSHPEPVEESPNDIDDRPGTAGSDDGAPGVDSGNSAPEFAENDNAQEASGAPVWRQPPATERPQPVRPGTARGPGSVVRPEDVWYPSDAESPRAPYDRGTNEEESDDGAGELRGEPHEVPEVHAPPRTQARPSLGLKHSATPSAQSSSETSNDARRSSSGDPAVVGEPEKAAGVESEPPDAEVVSGSTAPSVDDAPRVLESELSVPTPIEQLTVGAEATTFGKELWWSSHDWTKLPPAGPPDDVVTRVGVAGNLAVAGCSVRGRKHRHGVQNNDDYFTTAIVNHRESGEPAGLVAVVCDGMGSAEFSSFGSKALAEATAANLTFLATELLGDGWDHLGAHLNANSQTFLAEISDSVRCAVAHERPSWLRVPSYIPPEGVADRLLQSTLTFAVVEFAQIGQRSHAIIGCIGDSPAMSIEAGGVRALLVSDDNDGIHSTATEGALGATSLTLIKHEIRPGSPLLLATDGVANFLTYEGKTTRLGRYIAEQWSSPVDHLSFIRDVNFDLTSADDDRTVMAIWARD